MWWFLAFILVGAIVAIPVVLLVRLDTLKREIQDLASSEHRNRDLIQNLTRRLYLLEGRLGRSQDSAMEPAPEVSRRDVVAESPIEPVAPPGVPEPSPSLPVSLPAEPEPVAVAAPAEPESRRTREDWEVLIGGNWLNKLGVLAIVVGVAMFLGYSLTQLGPAGKVAIGMVVSLSMLGMGIALEQREGYRTFAQGLAGGGWAGVYFTTYAMHAIEGARILPDPVAGTIALLMVSILMIGYSFRYRSQAITSVAYLVGFVTLNITPIQPFTPIAALFLAASLVVIAWHYSWWTLAGAGIALTYLTFAFRYDPVVYSRPGILNGQSVLWIYWITFEAFDLCRIYRDRSTDRPLYVLNAAGFLAASIVQGENMSDRYWATLLGLSTAGYLISSALRYQWLPNGDSDWRIWSGRYHGPVVITALVGAAAMIFGWAGFPLSWALLAEVELFTVAGVLLSRRFLVHLGSATAFLPLLHWYAVDVNRSVQFEFLGHAWYTYDLFALAFAIALYANRIFARAVWLTGVAASLLLATVIHEEVQKSWATVIWAGFLFVLAAVGLMKRRTEFRVQAYLLAIAVFIRACAVNLEDASATRMWTCALIVLLYYAAQMLYRDGALGDVERYAAPAFSILGTTLLTALLFAEVQGRLLTVAVGIEGVVLLLAGFILRERTYRLSGLLLFLLCIAKLFVYDLRTLDTMSRILSFIVLGLMMVGASWIYTRFREQIKRLL